MQLSLFKFLFPSKKPKVPPRGGRRRRRRPRATASDAELKAIWAGLRRLWFPERDDVDQYTIVWSGRAQKRTLASCSTERKRIIVARELNYPHHKGWLSPLLYHEMCHVVLGDRVSRKGGKRAWHGREFKALERRHPHSKALDKWIKSGGWGSAVRSDRAKRAHQRRKSEAA